MALDIAWSSSAGRARELLEQARAQRGLVEAICHRPDCLNVMFEYRPVPDFYVLEKCRKCGFWNVFTTETPG